MPADGGYYELLGVRREATPAELRRAYESALARASREGATRHMVELVAAYEVLADPGRRRLYDGTGVAVPRERVPNTHGRVTPWRGGVLGHGNPTPRAAAPRRVPRRSVRTSRLIGVMLVLAASAGVGTVVAQRTAHREAGTRTVPAGAQTGPAGEVRVLCQARPGGSGYTYLARPGQVVSCANGAVPTWVSAP